MNNPPSTAAANHIPSSLRLVTIARLAEILAELQRETPGVLSATLASADGLTVASTLSNNHEADKLSAMFCFLDEILLHVSRGVRWDSDHVVLSAVAPETVGGRAAVDEEDDDNV